MTMSMTITAFLIIVGLALLLGHDVRAKAAAAIFLMLGIMISAPGVRDFVQALLTGFGHFIS